MSRSLPARAYATRAIVSPPSLIAMASVAAIGVWLMDALGAALFAFLVAAIAFEASSHPAVRRALDRATARRTRFRRACARFELLDSVGEERRVQHAQLTNLVDDLTEIDEPFAERLELDALLERYAEYALRRARAPHFTGEAEALDHELDAIADLVWMLGQGFEHASGELSDGSRDPWRTASW